MISEKQEKIKKYYGMATMIARKTGYNREFVGRVLNGTVNGDTPAGRVIKKLAMQITESLNKIEVKSEESYVKN